MTDTKIRVFLADDKLLSREGLNRILETAEYIEIVGEASDPLETIRKVIELKPDILLMDLLWHGDQTAGWSAIKEIKLEVPSVKVIAITAYENLIRDARRAGADAALTKTFGYDELFNMINELASRKESFSLPLSDAPIVFEELTSRELEVLKLMAQGHSNVEIGKSLNIAESTTKNHVKKILSKLGANNRTHAVSLAREQGLLS